MKRKYVTHKIGREDGIFMLAIQGGIKTIKRKKGLELITTNPPANSLYKTLEEIISVTRNRCI